MLSIVTPVLNGAEFILRNIKSVKELTIPYEHIIVDGGSTDGTLDLLKGIDGIQVFTQRDDLGMYSAIDQGFSLSKGHMLAWLNADDYIIPAGFELMYTRAMSCNSDLICGHGVLHFIEERRYQMKYWGLKTRLLLKSGIFPFVQSSVMFSKQGYYRVGGLNYLDFNLIGDRDLFQRMALESSIKFDSVQATVSVFLMHQNSLLYSNLEKIKNEYKYCVANNPNIITRLIFHLSQPLQRIIGLFKDSKI